MESFADGFPLLRLHARLMPEAALFFLKQDVNFANQNHELLRVLFVRSLLAELHPAFPLFTFQIRAPNSEEFIPKVAIAADYVCKAANIAGGRTVFPFGPHYKSSYLGIAKATYTPPDFERRSWPFFER